MTRPAPEETAMHKFFATKHQAQENLEVDLLRKINNAVPFVLIPNETNKTTGQLSNAFRFLDLPTDIRLLVCERISITTKCEITTDFKVHGTWLYTAYTFTLITQSTSTNILATCRKEYEALGIRNKRKIRLLKSYRGLFRPLRNACDCIVSSALLVGSSMDTAC